MIQLREYIKKEIKRLGEAIVKRPLPNDARNTLFDILKLKKSHIEKIQAVKSVKPTYRITLNNLKSFTISDMGNNFGFGLVKISDKEYDILDTNQILLAIKALNDLQTKPIINPTGDEEGGEETEEPVEEPVEEPEA